MNLDTSRTLKWSAAACAVLWSAAMIWWIGAFDPAAVIIFSIGGALFGLCWYLALRFTFTAPRMQPRGGETVAEDVALGRFYGWMVWGAAMTVSGVTTAALLDVVNPWLPAGDLHWLMRSLFIITVWPALMWSLRRFIKRHPPA